MSDYIKKVTCVTDNFKDGQKIVAARIQYNFEIDKSWISAPCFWVKDRKIIGIDVDGCEVTLQLDPSQREAGIVKPPSPPINLEEAPRITPKKLPEGVPSRDRPPAVCKPRKVIVRQVSEIKALDGTIIKPAEKDYISDEAVEPIICEFKQFEYGEFLTIYLSLKKTRKNSRWWFSFTMRVLAGMIRRLLCRREAARFHLPHPSGKKNILALCWHRRFPGEYI